MREFVAELHRRNRLLAIVGWLHVAALAVTLAMLVIDERQVMGINAWIKPLKFMVSLGLYVWTVAWISAYVQRPSWLIRFVTRTIALVIVVESALILLQAARGVQSHFNDATAFDAGVFSGMGLMIAIDTVMTAVVLVLLFRPSVVLAPAYLWSLRAGVAVFLIGGWIGGQMIVNGAHTIGAPDGGPGLPFFNWSTLAGDLRIAHGVGLHALQILPLAGFAISRSNIVTGSVARVATLAVFAGAYLAALLGLYWQAVNAEPCCWGS